MIKKTAIVGVVGALASATLSGCVTNEEPALPEGWSEPKVDEVPEIAAMYEDADGVLTVAVSYTHLTLPTN